MHASPSQRVIDRISQTCPRCHEPNVRIHACDNEKCSFRGCIKCVMLHEAGVARLKLSGPGIVAGAGGVKWD